VSYVSVMQGRSGFGEIDALRRMKRGVLYLFIAWLIMVVAVATVFTSFIVSIPGFIRGAGGPPSFTSIPPGVVVALVLFIIGVVIALVGFYVEFIPGVTGLARVRSEFSTPAQLIRLGYIVGLLLVLIGIPLILVIMGVFVILIGAVFILIGFIGVIILCFKLNDVYSNTLYLVAGILFIIGLFIPILAVIAWILLYAGLGSTVRKLQSTTPSLATQPV